MIIPVLKPIPFVESAVRTALAKLLSKPQLNNFIWLLSALILGQKFSLSHIENLLLNRKSDNAFSWFMSHSKLNLEQIWQTVLSYAVQTFKAVGLPGKFIIDDTIEKHSKFCRFIQGACTLYDHSTGAYVQGKCFVFLYFAINDKIRFPIGWKIYVPNQKSKYTLALELIDEAILSGFRCSYVLVDSWFAIAPFLNALQGKGLRYVCELKSNNKIWAAYEKKSFKLGLHQFFNYCVFATKKTVFGLKTEGNNTEVKAKYKTSSAICHLCALDHQTVLVESKMEGAKDPKYLITNSLRLEAQAILEAYSWRWLIEEFFGDEKKLLDFEGARVRNFQAGAITVLTLSCADLLLSLEIFKLSQEDSQSRALT
ncbi:MAG: transposase, partial [Nitrosotalea sp.]